MIRIGRPHFQQMKEMMKKITKWLVSGEQTQDQVNQLKIYSSFRLEVIVTNVPTIEECGDAPTPSLFGRTSLIKKLISVDKVHSTPFWIHLIKNIFDDRIAICPVVQPMEVLLPPLPFSIDTFLRIM